MKKLKKPPAIAIVLLVIALQITAPTPSAACPVFATLWDAIDQADWIAIVRVRRIEVDPTPGNPSSGRSDEHEVAVLEALDVWKGPAAMEVRVDLEAFAGAPFAEGDVVLVFLERGETRARRLDEQTATPTREELLEMGVDEADVAQLLQANVEARESALRFEKWAAGRWLHVSHRRLPQSDVDRDALERLVRAAARLQAAGNVSHEDLLEWLVSVAEQPAFREEALYSFLSEESSLTDEQLARLAGAFLRAPAVDASDILMLDLLARYPGSEVDVAAASVIEAALRMSRIPAWTTPMVAAALHRYGDDFSERIGRDDRDPSGRLIYMAGATETLPTIWAVARRDLGIPEVPPAEPRPRVTPVFDPYAVD